MLTGYRTYRRIGHSRTRSLVLQFFDLPLLTRIFG